MAAETVPAVDQNPPLTVIVCQHDDAAVVEVCGEVDLRTTPGLHDIVVAVLRYGPPVVVVDLLAVTFFGVSGIDSLLAAQRRAGGRSQLRVAAAGQTTRQLRFLGVDRRLPLYPTRREAVVGYRLIEVD